jgi:hypothetical protein
MGFIEVKGFFAPLRQDLARALYAAPAGRGRGTPLGRIANKRLFLLVALIPLLLGWAICAVVIAVDPLDLRPWGATPRFIDANYPELMTPKLARAVTRQPEDVILIGGSQAMGVTPAQIRNAFQVGRAVNLAYSLLRAPDAGALMQAAVRTPRLKRLVVELPFTLMEARQPPAATGASALSVLNARWYALPDFGDDVARASLERVRTGTYGLERWKREAAGFLGTENVLDNPFMRRLLAQGLAQVPAARFERRAQIPCGAFPFIRENILPVARDAASRGVVLDFYFPAISLQGYPRMEMDNTLSGPDIAFFDRLTSFHGCVASAIASAGLANVHVHALDLDPELVSDLRNFKDSYHLMRPDKFDRMLDDLRTARFEIKAGGEGAYRETLREHVLALYRSPRAPAAGG